MNGKVVVSLYDYTGVAVRPWAEAGYECFCYDIQHPTIESEKVGQGYIHKIKADLHDTNELEFILYRHWNDDVQFAMAFPVCTDTAVSGAAHFKRKAEADPDFQHKAAMYAVWCAQVFETWEIPYYIENPVSVLSTLWRKPNYNFHPFEYGGYIAEAEAEHPLYPDYIAPRDAYTKKTCLWTGGNFKMPDKRPVDCESYGSSRQHRKLGGKSLKTKNIRSATPRGFAQAIFEANRGW